MVPDSLRGAFTSVITSDNNMLRDLLPGLNIPFMLMTLKNLSWLLTAHASIYPPRPNCPAGTSHRTAPVVSLLPTFLRGPLLPWCVTASHHRSMAVAPQPEALSSHLFTLPLFSLPLAPAPGQVLHCSLLACCHQLD